jgi:hypothetical protein
MSYRAIISYYYHVFYLAGKTMWYSEIRRLTDKHVEVCSRNPVFYYDPDTFLWFIDFNRVGKSPKKVPFESVLETTNLGLKVFNVDEWIESRPYDSVEGKFHAALSDYYYKRKRPAGRRMLIPTFYECCNNMTKEEAEKTRTFSASDFALKGIDN